MDVWLVDGGDAAVSGSETLAVELSVPDCGSAVDFWASWTTCSDDELG